MEFNKTVDFNGKPPSRSRADDIINLTHEIPGWRASTQGGDHRFNQNLDVEVSCIEEDVDFYDDEYDISEHTKPDTTIINRTPAPRDGRHPHRGTFIITGNGPLRAPRELFCTSASVYPYWKEAQVWVKIGTGDYKYMTTSGQLHH